MLLHWKAVRTEEPVGYYLQILWLLKRLIALLRSTKRHPAASFGQWVKINSFCTEQMLRYVYAVTLHGLVPSHIFIIVGGFGVFFFFFLFLSLKAGFCFTYPIYTRLSNWLICFGGLLPGTDIQTLEVLTRSDILPEKCWLSGSFLK